MPPNPEENREKMKDENMTKKEAIGNRCSASTAQLSWTELFFNLRVSYFRD